MFVAETVQLAQPRDHLEIVLAELGEHRVRWHELAVIVEHALQLRDMADRADRSRAELAGALRHRIYGGEQLCGLLVEQQVIVAEVWPTRVPVEVLGLDV